MLKKYFERHFHFNQIFEGGPDGVPKGEAPARKNAPKGLSGFIVFLRLLPYLCGAAFAGSFFWDFGPEHSFEILSYTVTFESLIRTVAVGGLIGYGTNWLAIRMLFRPVERRPIWGQGLIPAQRDRIVFQLAGGIHKFILSEELIQKRIQDSGIIQRANDLLLNGTENLLHDDEFRAELKDLVFSHLEANMQRPEVRERIIAEIDERLEEKINKGLGGFMFKTYKKLRPAEYEGIMNNLMDSVPGTVIDIIQELEKETPKLMTFLKEKQGEMERFYMRLVVDILERIDIQKLLSKQMEHLDERGLEAMIRGATNRQLMYIQYLGTLLGILGGFLIANPGPVLVLYLSLIGILYLVDNFLYRMQQRRAVHE